MAVVGEQLLQPESGMQRIDDTDSKIIYNGNWNTVSSSPAYYYNNTLHSTTDINSNITFYFKGTKLNIISAYNTNMSNNVNIRIDGVAENFSVEKNLLYKALVYSKTDLENKIHQVEIETIGGNFILDAIDIDEDGYMCTEDEYLLQEGKAEFPIKVADDSVQTEDDVANYTATLTNGERQLLLLNNGDMYLSDGNGSHIKMGGSSEDSHSNREVLDLLSTDGESLYFNGKNIQKIELEDGQYGYSGTFMNVVADSTYSINLDKGSKLCEQIVQVWEFEEGGTDLTTVAKTFNNHTTENFFYDDNMVFTDEVCKIKDEYVIDNKTKSGDYYTSEPVKIDEFIDIDSITDTVGYKYYVNNSPIGFRNNLSTNNYAVQYNIYVDSSKQYTSLKILSNYEGGGVQFGLFSDDIKPVLVQNKFNNICHAVIGGKLYIIINGEHIFDRGAISTSGGNSYLFYFGADPNGTGSSAQPEQLNYAVQGYYIYKLAYFAGITSLEDFKSVLDTKMKYDSSTKFIKQFHDFSNSSNLTPVVGTQPPFGYTASNFSRIKTKFLLKSNDKYYSLKDENYNADTGLYNEVTINNYDDFNSNYIEVEKFIAETTIGDEIFKPIDKFNNFEIISNEEFELVLKGIKSNKEMVVGKQSFSTRLAKNIDFFELISTISDTSSIKMVISIDEGVTWKTWNGAEFIDLTNTCPLKEYSSLTENEKTQWNTFIDEINRDGIDSATLSTLDFNSIISENMMFAYVFNRDSYADVCEMSKLQYQFDAYGSYTLLNSDSVVNIKQSVDAISVTPKKDIELMKVNIGSSGEVNIIQDGGTADIDLPTDEEVDNMINGVISDVFA